jgi:hypothetical protein
MTTYSYSQLEGLWIQGGGSRVLAPLMAAIAMAESSGNSLARNPSGASGLWQINGLPFPGNPFDPLTNARMAVAKYHEQGLNAWVTYTNGAYKQFFKGQVPPTAYTGPGGDSTGIQTTSFTGDIIGAIAGALGLGADLKGFFIRAGLIVLGGILLVAGLIMAGKGHEGTNVNVASSPEEQPEAEDAEIPEAA